MGSGCPQQIFRFSFPWLRATILWISNDEANQLTATISIDSFCNTSNEHLHSKPTKCKLQMWHPTSAITLFKLPTYFLLYWICSPTADKQNLFTPMVFNIPMGSVTMGDGNHSQPEISDTAMDVTGLTMKSRKWLRNCLAWCSSNNAEFVTQAALSW